MQCVDVFTSCVYPVYISWIMDSVSYLLLVIWESKLGWSSWKYCCGVGCISVQRVLWGCSVLELLWGWEGT